MYIYILYLKKQTIFLYKKMLGTVFLHMADPKEACEDVPNTVK